MTPTENASAVQIPLPRHDDAFLGQVSYALHFCDPAIQDFDVNGAVSLTLADGANAADVAAKVERLVNRFAAVPEGFEPREIFRVSAPHGTEPHPDPYDTLVARGWVTPVMQGQVVLRGPALDLMEFFDAEAVRRIAVPMGARAEYYPSGISCDSLAKTQHFSSFPEHIHFVSHLHPDLDVIDTFADRYKAHGSVGDAMGTEAKVFEVPAFVMNPSVCYHCYAALTNHVLEAPGIVVTARSRCQRYEGGNHETLRRLMDFTMREVIFVGTPDHVMETRSRSIELLEEMVRGWELDSWLETSNDPFFTNDYATKAAFQRFQDFKYELRATLPFEKPASVAVASSNFHSVNFGRGFNIKVNGRPACTGCLGFGLERLMYAVFSQHGLDMEAWPAGLRDGFAAWKGRTAL